MSTLEAGERFAEFDLRALFDLAVQMETAFLKGYDDRGAELEGRDLAASFRFIWLAFPKFRRNVPDV